MKLLFLFLFSVTQGFFAENRRCLFTQIKTSFVSLINSILLLNYFPVSQLWLYALYPCQLPKLHFLYLVQTHSRKYFPKGTGHVPLLGKLHDI